MPKIQYVAFNFKAETLAVIEQANTIITSYLAQGYRLTLRQLYYQFVSRDLLPNTQKSYKRLGGIVSDARLHGMIDWSAIEDRTRSLSSLSHFTDPPEIVSACAEQFRIDKWARQPHRVEVWIEKEALAGVFERVCQELDVPFLCCRGYTSLSEMWGASQRLKKYDEQEIIILHFGDHDPSGIDMTRDIQDRLATFGLRFDMRRLALNMDQIEQYAPPPNPAKETDSRFAGYIEKYGDESFELDALEPQVLADLVRNEIRTNILDDTEWEAAEAEEQAGKDLLTLAADNWRDVAAFIKERFEP